MPNYISRSDADFSTNNNNNQLVKLPTMLGCLEALQLLDVRGNVLQSLPDSFALLTSLTRLRASGNRLLKLPDAWQVSFDRIEAIVYRLLGAWRASFDQKSYLTMLFSDANQW